HRRCLVGREPERRPRRRLGGAGGRHRSARSAGHPPHRTPPAGGVGGGGRPNDGLVAGSGARAAGTDPRDLPGIRTIARHELVESWEATAPAPELSGLAHGAGTARVLAAREQGMTAVRRTLEDARLVSRNLRKVPQALRRRLAARSGKPES